jgi:hypothetical protein
MRLPTDPSQWGVIVIQSLVQKIPALEPYIQMAHLIQPPSPEGDGFGVVPLMNGTGFVPFTVKGFELAPLDLIITVEGGEERFTALNEGSAIMAAGGIPMGSSQGQLPPGVDEDVALDMQPVYEQGFNGNRNNVPGRFTQTKPVKMGGATVESAEAMLKAAAEVNPETLRYVADYYRERLVELAKEAKASPDAIFTLEPNGTGVLYMHMGDPKTARQLSAPDAAIVLRELGLPEKVANLMADELVVIDQRPAEKRAGVWNHEELREFPDFGQAVKEPGWYIIQGLKMRAFRTSYLNGRPCTYWLAVHPTGYIFSQELWGKSCEPPTTVELKDYYRVAHLRPNELGFMIEDGSGEASIPYQVVGGGQHGGSAEILVTPLLGEAEHVRLSFGPNQHRYAMGAHTDANGKKTEAVAMPKRGFTPLAMADKDLAPSSLLRRGIPVNFGDHKTVTVRLYRGGGVFSLKEDGHAPYDGLNRGQLAAILMRRYGMTADQAIEHVGRANAHIDTCFRATPIEEPRRAPMRGRPTVMKVAALLWDFTRKLAAAKDGPDSEKVKPGREDKAPAGSGPGPAGAGGQQPAGAQQPQLPAQVPNLANTGAALMPDIPNMQEITDILTSYATGTFAPDELADIYNRLTDKLDDVCDLVGRVLLLARLGKVDFITEAEAKRVLEESDKLRAALMNADMLLKGIAVAA